MKLRVHLLCETDRFGNPHGSAHIRLLRPFSHPVLSEFCRVTTGEGVPVDGVDIVLVERGWRADATLEAAEKLVADVRALGAKLIYTLDDNLLDLHRCQPWHEFSTDAKRNIVRFFLRKADGVVVSTEPLKQRFQHLNGEIHVVPNALDERLFIGGENGNLPRPAVANSKLVIGYMGTHSHLQDLLLVLEPLRAVLRKYQGAVEFQMVGISEDNRIVRSFEDLPFRILDTEGKHFYPDFVPWARENLCWDVAIAPLENNRFTRGKSDIKFLDYALLRIPGIYSDVEAYRHSVVDGETGMLCENVPAVWKLALEQLLEARAMRDVLLKSAYNYVVNKRILKHCASDWKNVIMAFAGKN